jgi:hypothetical protein
MDDPISVALVQRPIRMRLFGMTAAPALTGSHSMGSEELLLLAAPITGFEAGEVFSLRHYRWFRFVARRS